MAAEIFKSSDIRRLFKDKFVVVIGSSVMRSVYKDLVKFLQSDNYLSRTDLRSKGEKSCNGDEMHEGGNQHNGTHYREVRQYLSEDGNYCIRFYFITKTYNPYFETILEDLRREPTPDVVIMNSCLWDMSRYGPKWMERYKTNLDISLGKIKEILPADCLFIWTTCTPVGATARGGVFMKNILWRRETLRFDVLEANFYAKQSVIAHEFDVLDLHYYMRNHLHLRAADAIHWNGIAHRRITNLLLLHFCDAYGLPKPKIMKPLPMKLPVPRPHPGMVQGAFHGSMTNLNFSNPMEMDFNNNECFSPMEHNNGFFENDEGFDEVDNGFNHFACAGQENVGIKRYQVNMMDTYGRGPSMMGDSYVAEDTYSVEYEMVDTYNKFPRRGQGDMGFNNYPLECDTVDRYGGPMTTSAPLYCNTQQQFASGQFNNVPMQRGFGNVPMHEAFSNSRLNNMAFQLANAFCPAEGGLNWSGQNMDMSLGMNYSPMCNNNMPQFGMNYEQGLHQNAVMAKPVGKRGRGRGRGEMRGRGRGRVWGRGRVKRGV